MPSINDIVQVAEALEKGPIVVMQDRCVAVRNRNATCRKCVEACLTDAIEVIANEVHLDGGACVSCGACVATCPTEALVLRKSADSDLVNAAGHSIVQNEGTAVIACARMASKRLADPSRYAEASCLGRVEESMILSLVANGAKRVLLVDGMCETCKYGACSGYIDDAVHASNELIEAMGCNAEVRRVSGFPDSMIVESTEGMIGSTRRGFFSEAAGAAKETAMTAAKATIVQDLGLAEDDVPIGQRLSVGEDGAMPRLRMPRHDALINAMDAIGIPVADVLESRRFAQVTIDTAKCNACGMCAVFCPTHALRRDDEGDEGAPRVLRRIEFWAADCVQCGLCVDLCWKNALTLSASVPMSQLFDFEPVSFDMK